MNRKWKYILSCFILLQLVVPIVNAQDDEALLKYWYYRNRLSHFTIPGTQQGQSQIAGVRNEMAGQPIANIGFGQHGIYFGYYLGTLATEYRILINVGNEDDALLVETEITYALDQFIEYLDKCEMYWGLPNIFDGFFIRTSVPSTLLSENPTNVSAINEDLIEDENTNFDYASHSFHLLPQGHPGYLPNSSWIGACVTSNPLDGDETMSQDEAIGVLMGLALVRACGTSELADKAAEIARRIIWRISNGNFWLIVEPDGTVVPAEEGGNCGLYSYGFEKAAEYFNLPAEVVNPNCASRHSQRSTWQLFSIDYSDDISNNAMECTLAAIGKSWGAFFEFPCIPPFIYEPDPPIFPNSTMTNIKNKMNDWDIETFYCLLLGILHPGTEVDQSVLTKAQQQIESAPGEGPFSYKEYGVASGGWAYSYRWRGYISEQNLGKKLDDSWSTSGNFNGTDYMLLYNMYLIYNNSYSSKYHPYKNLDLIGNWPIQFEENQIKGDFNNPVKLTAHNEINSSQIVWEITKYDENQNLLAVPLPNPGDISYFAKEIILKPGFEAHYGSKFLAHSSSHIFWSDFTNAAAESMAKIKSKKEFEIQALKPYKDTFSGKQGMLTNTISYDSILIYPNPTSDILTVYHENFKNCNIMIINMVGDVMYDEFAYEFRNSINCDDFPKGMYICCIKTEFKTFYTKFIKK